MFSDNFQLLSDELVVYIFKQLDSFSLFQCSQTCRRWRRLATENRLWERLSQRIPLLRVEELFQGDHRKACLHRVFQQRLPVNRILATLKDSTIVTCNPDGTDIHIVAKASSQENNFKQPCWDPFGKSILFTYFQSFASHICVVVDSNGKRKELAISTPPFYYLWFSDGNYFTFIAEHGAAPLCLYLSSVLDEIALPVELCTLNTFFFDTCSHEDYLVAHINGDTIALLNLKSFISSKHLSHQEMNIRETAEYEQCSKEEAKQSQVILTHRAGYFAAPQWISNTEHGDFILYLERDDNIPSVEGLQADRLLLSKVNVALMNIEYTLELGSYFGRKAFHMTSHMKYISILEESTTQVALPNVQNPTTLQVYQLDNNCWNWEPIVFTQEYSIWNEPSMEFVSIQYFQGVRAFQWSPDHEKLLCLVIQSLGESHDIRETLSDMSTERITTIRRGVEEEEEGGRRRRRRRKRKWESYFLVLDIPKRSIYRYSNLILSCTFVCNFLPFFDQFIKSQTFWSPHSDAFCYVGQHENASRYGIEEEQGLFVQYLDQSPPKLLLRNVEYATWSPL
ncbi:hypothetical protein Gasu2_67910 [Galdieria sulphuraria]|nr:hypothetical protein Gasu2_67910 [Galdieria sulphuraria]